MARSVWSRLKYTIFISLFLYVAPSALGELAEEEALCSGRSCYPATGNLLIGRKNQLTASSTCGLRERQKFCIVSHLEDDTKCFYCDSSREWDERVTGTQNSHRIQNVVTENYEERTRNWWQSENGVQNVSIELKLGAEFHFTHLIMTFRSFRPAAMVIEKSADYGKTYRIYRYFAYDCASSFPDIPEGPPKNHTDVICTRKYSDVAPSTGGEVIYKVISPHIQTENPYAKEIAELLKITNLRINFTKLHTLGDDLLDYRPEIDEKYYYAIYEIVVRGSCSCYGHAHSCVPDADEQTRNEPEPADMVHGKCQCTHNTDGKNCEKCSPYYNDAPWKPAYGDQANECQRCNCNNHANSCHFDEATYIASGNVSGGICDECNHNTQGIHCEQCKPYFFLEPGRTIDDVYACRPCACDKRGSLNDGICQGEENPEKKLVAGKCYCKPNVDGPNCDRCKNGFWDLREDDPNGCKACTCNLLGTYNNEGCNKYDGSCTCKALVEGENCDRCKPNHYGMSNDPEGCKACDCDIGGALDNECDVNTGQCKCRDKFTGRRCNTTESSYFCPLIDFHTYEAESSENTISHGEVITRERSHGRPVSWTGEGFVKVNEKSNITFPVNDLLISGPYNLIIRYEINDDGVGWEDIQITLVRPEDPSQDGPCANSLPSDDFHLARLTPRSRYFEIQPPICLEAGVAYEIRLYMGNKRMGVSDPNAYAYIDSIVLAPPTNSLDIFQGSEPANYKKMLFDRYQCRHLALSLTPTSYLPLPCNQSICPLAGAVFGKALSCECDATGTVSGVCTPTGGQCECKPNVVGRTCDRCAVGTYGFGPNGCLPCECDSQGALSNACDKQSGQCECIERGITGRQCNQCQPGFWSFPTCRTCTCNGHSPLCDQTSGACIDCRNLTRGHNCDRCVEGYYGDPRLGANIPCKSCPCPGGPGSGFQHADSCYLQPTQDLTQDLVCNCRTGYKGKNCELCELNYWGNPREIGGSCEKCDCNNNIDRNLEGSCDVKTGHCLKCLHNTDGIQCEHCKEGFYGDAKQPNCRSCVCYPAGTNSSAGACDRVSGECPCYPNVIGEDCSECAPQHFNIASEKGCEDCACDPQGVVLDVYGQPDLECNRIDGQCHCKAGRGGRTCGECQDFYWGDPVHGECQPCECDRYGSETMQCHRDNGTCICRPGSGGPLCNQCSRGYTGQWPQCQPCGECFNNWDRILQELRSDLDGLIDRANNIEDTGISSEYDETFEKMESQIASVRAHLSNINITKEDVDGLQKQIEQLQTDTDSVRNRLAQKNDRVTAVSSAVELAEKQVNSLREKEKELTRLAEELRSNATLIRRSDTKGAYELIRELAEKSGEYQAIFNRAVGKINAAETDRNKAEKLLNEHKDDFDAQYKENQQALQEIESMLAELEGSLPALNKQVCGGETADCDPMCGGPSAQCGFCGGESCLGSLSKAKQALDFAQEADEKLREKQKEAEDLLSRLRETSPETTESQQFTRSVHDQVEAAARTANETKQRLENQIKEIREFLDADQATPDGIQTVVDEILAITIPFDEEKIQELSKQIRDKVLEAKNTDQILSETRGNKTVAENLQRGAENAHVRAEEVHKTAKEIQDALKKAEDAQAKAQETLDSAVNSNEDLGNTLSGTETEVDELVQRMDDANNRIADLHNKTEKLKSSYIKITSSSKSAGEKAQSATEIAKDVEKKRAELNDKYQQVEQLLNERVNGNDDRKERAEKLHKRTTDLLVKINGHNSDADYLKRSADALEVELGNFKQRIGVLSREIDTIAGQIEQKVSFHETCDN
ncbi:Laminin subunit beta-1 [Aphelenchoides besseyi]|nr:Laminin subunit beta-1 [Aphelenchoides besseyi]